LSHNKSRFKFVDASDRRKPYLTVTLLTWRIWWAPNNASKWQIGI